MGGRLIVWQSKYVASLRGEPRAAREMARLLSGNIVGRSLKPSVSRHLPPNGLIAASEKYFIDPELVARELDIDAKRLGLENSVEVAAADYRIDGESATLILFLYPTQQLAKKYAEDWLAAEPDFEPFHARVSPLLAIVRGATDASVSGMLLSEVNYETQVIWNERPPAFPCEPSF